MNFSELNLHPTVAGALAKRGYDTATSVQAAVLHPDAAGRDLLVSSQTGSGKTIAFGAALAETLLAPEAARTGPRTNPLALVVVPTRELAVQVREELGWLLRDTKLRLASFTGGTPVTGDLRTLQKGLDVAIGTPGRLVDLLKRQRLELADIRVVVLDEADEMLDLGFREDLQTLLQAAPETRRTLLLSATIPSEIQALARRFQRDALRIDPRKEGDPAARGAHGDIAFVAHLIAGADRLAVVVNILRAAGDGRAIVFCTTREGVSRLHAALVSRGFAATAISGDRAQAERDRALEQVRKGDARVLVATNVAARGLHLPDVDLIIHADLPLNAESLTHRSGRTGRAGRKGTAVVIASMTERRKAERLMMSAHVPVVWTAPPSAESITAAARERLADELLQEAATADAPAEDPAAEEMVKRLEELLPARELARRLLLRELVRLPVGERIHHVAVPGPERRDRFAPASRGDLRGDVRRDDRADDRRPGRDDFAREGVMFRVNLGAQDNADPRWILPLICRRGGVGSKDVGAIRVGPQETVFEISGDAAADFAVSAAERDPRAPHVTFEPLRPLDNRGRDARGPQQRAPDRLPQRAPSDRPTHTATPPPRATAIASAPVATPPGRMAARPGAKPTVPDEGPPARETARHPLPIVKGPPATLSQPSPTAGVAVSAAATRPEPTKKRAVPARVEKSDRTVPPAPSSLVSNAGPQPASIFQTRTPEPRPQNAAAAPGAPFTSAGRPVRAHAPIIEMKRAPVVGRDAHRPPPGRADTVPPPRPMNPAFASQPPRSDRPRTDGTNHPKRSFNAPHPSKATPSPRPTQPAQPMRAARADRPAPPTRPAADPTRPPFWKDGARKRPGPSARHPDGDAPRGKPARR